MPTACIGAVAVRVSGCVRQHGFQLGRVVNVGGRDLDAADQPSLLVGRDVRLVAVHGLTPAMTSPARLVVMRDARRRDQGRVHQRAGADHDAALIELTRDGLEQGSVQASADQRGTETDKGGALRCGLMNGETAEPAKAGAIIESLSEPHVGEVVPSASRQSLWNGPPLVEVSAKPGKKRDVFMATVRPVRGPAVFRGVPLTSVIGGSKTWVLRYEHQKRERWMGLGLEFVTLAQARERAFELRRCNWQGALNECSISHVGT